MYCGPRCRWRSSARRKRGVKRWREDPSRPPVSVGAEEIAEELALLYVSERETAEEELVGALLVLESASGQLARLEHRLPRRLAARASVVASRVDRALRVSFPEVLSR